MVWNKRNMCLKGSRLPEVVELDYSTSKLEQIPDNVFLYERTLQYLTVNGNYISHIPRELFLCQNLCHLDLSDNEIATLPPSIGSLTCLETLLLNKNSICKVPEELNQCTKLLTLNLTSNPIRKLPAMNNLNNLNYLGIAFLKLLVIPNLKGLSALKSVDVQSNQLAKLPFYFQQLISLTSIDLSTNFLQSWPKEMHRTPKLQELILSENFLETFVMGDSPALTTLDLSKNKISNLIIHPSTSNPIQPLHPSNQTNNINQFVTNLPSISHLDLTSNQLIKLPHDIGVLKSLAVLKLDENFISSLPESISGLTQLQELNLNHNNLVSIPACISQLQNLRIIMLNYNSLTKLPAQMTQLKKLEVLSITWNHLDELPEDIGEVSKLQVLNLIGNCLTRLPASLIKLNHLRSLWINSEQTRPLVDLHAITDKHNKVSTLECAWLPQTNKQPPGRLHVSGKKRIYFDPSIRLKSPSREASNWNGLVLKNLSRRYKDKHMRIILEGSYDKYKNNKKGIVLLSSNNNNNLKRIKQFINNNNNYERFDALVNSGFIGSPGCGDDSSISDRGYYVLDKRAYDDCYIDKYEDSIYDLPSFCSPEPKRRHNLNDKQPINIPRDLKKELALPHHNRDVFLGTGEGGKGRKQHALPKRKQGKVDSKYDNDINNRRMEHKGSRKTQDVLLCKKGGEGFTSDRPASHASHLNKQFNKLNLYKNNTSNNNLGRAPVKGVKMNFFDIMNDNENNSKVKKKVPLIKRKDNSFMNVLGASYNANSAYNFFDMDDFYQKTRPTFKDRQRNCDNVGKVRSRSNNIFCGSMSMGQKGNTVATSNNFTAFSSLNAHGDMGGSVKTVDKNQEKVKHRKNVADNDGRKSKEDNDLFSGLSDVDLTDLDSDVSHLVKGKITNNYGNYKCNKNNNNEKIKINNENDYDVDEISVISGSKPYDCIESMNNETKKDTYNAFLTSLSDLSVPLPKGFRRRLVKKKNLDVPNVYHCNVVYKSSYDDVCGYVMNHDGMCEECYGEGSCDGHEGTPEKGGDARDGNERQIHDGFCGGVRGEGHH